MTRHISEKAVERFQEQLRRFIPNQSETNIFHCVGMYSDGATGDGYDPLTGGEYIERLENDYFQPWETSWRFGASAESKSNVLSLFQATVTGAQSVYEMEKFPVPYSEAPIEGYEVIARHTPAEVGLGLASRLQSSVLIIKEYWIDKTIIFDELAEKIVTLKKREWAELQQTYTVQ